jgi:hypothetical protein
LRFLKNREQAKSVMRYLRRHLRLLTVASLAVQATWLPALVPLDCCARHCEPAGVMRDDCPADDSFHGHDGEGAGLDHQISHHDESDGCALQTNCPGPLAAFGALLAQTGVTVDRLVSLPEPAQQPSPATAPERSVDYRTPPDTPPPRA